MGTKDGRQYYERILEEIARDNGFGKPRFEFSAGSKKGDNFIGVLLRVVVTDESDASKHLRLMVKLPSDNELHRIKYRVDEFFKTEAIMYGNILPVLADFLKKKGLLNDNIFPGTPRAYKVCGEGGPELIIVMEDLGVRGFVMQDRTTGLDEQHCRLVLRQLALLHAASLALQKQNPELHEKLSDQLTERVFPGAVTQSFIKAMDNCRDLINNRFPVGTIGREKFEKQAKINREYLVNCVKRNSDLCCINHGDLWVNNLLFKCRPGSTEPEEVCFLDLQVARMASPILDISYFICHCTRKSTRESLPSLFKLYHDSLSNYLLDLGEDPNVIVPWNLFQRELRKYFCFGWGCAVRLMPQLLMDEQEIREFDKQFSKDEEERKSYVLPYNTENLKTVLGDLLEDLVKFELI